MGLGLEPGPTGSGQRDGTSIMEGEPGTAVLAGVAITLTVQVTFLVFWNIVRQRSKLRAESAKLEAETARRVRSLEMRLDSHVDGHRA